MNCQQIITADNEVTEETKRVQQGKETTTEFSCTTTTSKNSSIESEEEAKPLPEGFVPGPMDVICARGKSAFSHPGNRRYRKIIRLHLQDYSNAKTKSDKSCIVSYIMDSIREASSSGVGFVKLMEDNDNRWVEVGEHVAREKIGQSFRDLLHTKYRSSSKAKKLRQKNRREKSTSSNSSPDVGKPQDKGNDQQLPDTISGISDVGVIGRTVSFSDGENHNEMNTINDDNNKTTQNNTSPSSSWDDDNDEPIPIDQAPIYASNIVSPQNNGFSESTESYCKELLDVMDTICEDEEPIPIHEAQHVPEYKESKELLYAVGNLWDTPKVRVF